MAIPSRRQIKCPHCGASEAILIADTSVGPKGRFGVTPIYQMLKRDYWPQSQRDSETFVSCARCGEKEFATVNHIARVGPIR